VGLKECDEPVGPFIRSVSEVTGMCSYGVLKSVTMANSRESATSIARREANNKIVGIAS
jgi:hypothetical protein